MEIVSIKRLAILSGILLIALVGIFSYDVINKNFTGKTIENEYTYTKAVCDENNFCEDYVIVCKNGSVESITPTGYTVQNPEDWQDPRDKEIRDKWCEG